MTGIDDFDADGVGIHIDDAAPIGLPGVPSAFVLVHQRAQLSGQIDQVMSADLAFGIAETIEGGLKAFHPGIMEDDHRRLFHAPALIEIS